MGGEAGIPQGLGQPAALLWLLLLNVATLELRGSPATAAPGPTAGDGGALRGCAPTWQAQRLAPGATGGRGVSTVCGISKVMGRIYGGRDVEAGRRLWQASLWSQGSHICGAVLINSSWLLSTAHCFLKCASGERQCQSSLPCGVDPSLITAPSQCPLISRCQTLDGGLGPHEIQSPVELRGLLGSTQLSQHTREVSVSQIITHPDFKKLHPFGSDIAMLQLLYPVNFTSYIIPACLLIPGMKLPSNSSYWIPGWGMLNEENHPGLSSYFLILYFITAAESLLPCKRLLLTALNLTHSAQEHSKYHQSLMANVPRNLSCQRHP
ncbi:putative serine protease 47 [Bos taurus]|uniref:putative serine protease 47 n=1 Tax=Bos taurus TaxID=9913 RepID=UPI0028CB3455|nr:putative serine protease 47 [Bos taurus]